MHSPYVAHPTSQLLSAKSSFRGDESGRPIGVNRKMMAVLVKQEPYSFRAIVEEAKTALKGAVLKGPPVREYDPTVVPDADAPTTLSERPWDTVWDRLS